MTPTTFGPAEEPIVLDGFHLPAGLDAARAALWTVDREMWLPRTIQYRGGAALTVGRRHTAYRKIVDVLAPDIESYRRLVQAAEMDVPPDPQGDRPAPLVVHLEEHPHVAALTDEQRAVLAELGFCETPDPVPSIDSTRPDSPAFTRRWSKWLRGTPRRTVPYYGQTTDFTCGPAAALMLLEGVRPGRLSGDHDENRSAEIALWRSATNTAGCDPFSLTIALAHELGDDPLRRAPRLVISAPDLLLVEDGTPEEHRMRETVQRDSLRRAQHSGLSIERRWPTVEELHASIAAGADALLMITLEPLIGDPTPHWVLVHDAIAGTLIVSDPWAEAPRGETWVDVSETPIPLTAVDKIARLGTPVCRGFIEVAPR